MSCSNNRIGLLCFKEHKLRIGRLKRLRSVLVVVVWSHPNLSLRMQEGPPLVREVTSLSGSETGVRRW